MQLIQKTGDNSWGYWVKDGDPIWYAISSYAEKDIPKGAGFSWQKDFKVWWTSDRDKAAKLAEYATGGLREELLKIKVRQTVSLAGSRAAKTSTVFPHPDGFDYFGYQKAGIEYMIDRKNTLLADDMGLGKTIQVIGLTNTDDSIKTVLVVCPATIKLNWKREFDRWTTRGFKCAIADSKVAPLPEHGYNVVIINYEALIKKVDVYKTVKWDLLAIDEAHYLKNIKTKRYQAIVEICANRRVYATGTPIVNYPSELWPLISAVDPDRWNQKTYWFYHKRYCNVQSNGYGMDYRGAASEERLNELQNKLRETIMIRRLKVDVLTDLPPKIRQVVELEYDSDDMAVQRALQHEAEYESLTGAQRIELAARAELAKASESDDEYIKAIAATGERTKVSFEQMAKIRHETALAKTPYAIEYVKEMFENGVNKIVVFAHHHDVMAQFAKAWPLESVSIHGEVSLDDRQAAVDRFQTDANCKLAICGIKAAGVGITLTAASHVVFVELDWVPGNITQAEDRCHRIGQKDSVNVYHLVLRESIDVNMANTLIEKQKVIEAALDKIAEQEPIVAIRDKAATRSSSRKQIAEIANKLTTALIGEVHSALKIVAGYDNDYAHIANGVGFNKIDSRIGHELAEKAELTARQAALGLKLIKKYRKQLPSEVVERLFTNEEEKQVDY